MVEKNNVKRYQEQDAICKEQIAIIEPFLKKFSEEHDCGTKFYSDITVLDGLSLYGPQWFSITEEGKNIYERYEKNKLSLYTIKWAGASFVIDYKVITNPGGRFARIPTETFMVHKNMKYPVPLDLALAVQKLYKAQEYRSVIYGAHRDEIDRARIAEMKHQHVR